MTTSEPHRDTDRLLARGFATVMSNLWLLKAGPQGG